jgi:hypothetical protein
MGNDEVVFGRYEGAMRVIRIDFIVGTFCPLTIYRHFVRDCRVP